MYGRFEAPFVKCEESWSRFGPNIGEDKRSSCTLFAKLKGDILYHLV
jgi:hypothetical protein